MISPVRMHITLGVMALDNDDGPRTVQSALDLLNSLRPLPAVSVPLEEMGVFDRGKGMAGVLWIGPKEGETMSQLKEVSELVHSAFRKAGYITENRPLKLHCTLVNTSHRKPRRRSDGFSFTDVLASKEAMDLIGYTSPTQKKTVGIDLGRWDVTEIQLCEMGRKRSGPKGEYFSCGGITLT